MVGAFPQTGLGRRRRLAVLSGPPAPFPVRPVDQASVDEPPGAFGGVQEPAVAAPFEAVEETHQGLGLHPPELAGGGAAEAVEARGQPPVR